MRHWSAREILACLPKGKTLFAYERDHYCVMLARWLVEAGWSARDIRASRFGRVLEKPRLKQLLKDRGRLELAADDFVWLVPERPDQWRLTAGSWGSAESFQYFQISRPGRNIVLQLNFPHAHNSAMVELLTPAAAKQFSNRYHPHSRRENTLAWARLDVDLESGSALIEEIQSDWIRRVRHRCEYPRSLYNSLCRNRGNAKLTDFRNFVRSLRHYRYRIMEPLARDWQEVMLAAALHFLVDELGIRDIYMHEFKSGNRLKCIDENYSMPPRSIYTALPKKFCFEAGHPAPDFLVRPVCSRRKSGKLKIGDMSDLAFWRLDLEKGPNEKGSCISDER